MKQTTEAVGAVAIELAHQMQRTVCPEHANFRTITDAIGYLHGKLIEHFKAFDAAQMAGPTRVDISPFPIIVFEIASLAITAAARIMDGLPEEERRTLTMEMLASARDRATQADG